MRQWAVFLRKLSRALSLKGSRIQGFAFLRANFRACGLVELSNATIGLDLECDGGKFLSTDEGAAITASNGTTASSSFADESRPARTASMILFGR